MGPRRCEKQVPGHSLPAEHHSAHRKASARHGEEKERGDTARLKLFCRVQPSQAWKTSHCEQGPPSRRVRGLHTSPEGIPRAPASSAG
eukprot:333833-Karenia_brevis.AAC.1